MIPNKYQKAIRNIDNYPYIEFIFLVLITILAFALRIYHLGTWSFWWDELFTVRDAISFWDYDLIDRTPFRFLNYLMLSNREINEWNTRIIPAMVGMLTLPIIYLPIRKIFGKGVGLISLLLLAISPWHIYWSQSARFYTTLLLFYTLALLLFYIAIEEDNTLYLVISMAFMGLAIIERFTSAIIAAVVGFYIIFFIISSRTRPIGLNIKNILILVLPGFFAMVVVAHRFLCDVSGFNANWINNNPFWILAGVGYYIGLPVICIGVVGAGCFILNKNRAILLLFINATLPILAIAFLSLFIYTANRYTFVTLTSWLILAAIAVRELLANNSGYVKLFGIGVMGILIVSPISEDLLYFRYQNGNRDDWKSAFNYIKQHKQPADVVVSANPNIGDYYLGDPTIDMATFEPDTIQNSGMRIWFVEDFNADEKWPKVHKWITANARLVGVFDVHVQARNFSMRVYLFDPINQ